MFCQQLRHECVQSIDEEARRHGPATENTGPPTLGQAENGQPKTGDHPSQNSLQNRRAGMIPSTVGLLSIRHLGKPGSEHGLLPADAQMTQDPPAKHQRVIPVKPSAECLPAPFSHSDVAEQSEAERVSAFHPQASHHEPAQPSRPARQCCCQSMRDTCHRPPSP